MNKDTPTFDAEDAFRMGIRDIPSLPGYAVDKNGAIYSRWTRRPLPNKKGSVAILGARYRTIRTWISNGRPSARFHVNGRPITRQVGKAILEAFCGPPPAGKTWCLHKNDNPLDNRLENLYWGSRIDNVTDRHRNGRQVKGMRCHNSVLTPRKVRCIRQLAKSGMTRRSLAEKYGCSQYCITAAVNKMTWNHIQ